MSRSIAVLALLAFVLSATTLPGCRWIRGEKPQLLVKLEEAVPAIKRAAESGTRTADALTSLVTWIHEKLVWLWIALAGAGFTFGKTIWRFVRARLRRRTAGSTPSSPPSP